MRLKSVVLMRTAVADMRARHDQRRPVLDRLGLGYGSINRGNIHPVDMLHMPSIGRESRAHIFGEGNVGAGREGDLIGVVDHDQSPEPKLTRYRGGFGRDAFHHVAVAGHHIRMVIHHVVAGPIECGGQPALRDCQSHRVPNTLTERTGGNFHPGHDAILGMARSAAPPLAEVLDVVHGKVVAGEEQHAVDQHARVSGRQDEPIAIGPFGVGGIVPEMACPQDVRHRRRAQRHPRMARVRFLDGVDRERPDSVDA